MVITIPIVFTDKYNTEDTSTDNYAETQYSSADYGNLSTISLLHSQQNTVEEIFFDEYLYGVVAAEMPASYNFSALQAQAVVARTYTLFQIVNSSKHENADICDSSSCCQAWISKENRFARWDKEYAEQYWEKIVDSVDSTSGKYITYNNQPINAFFHANSGGQTELSVNVWGGNYPYLQSVPTVGEEAYSNYQSEIILTKDELVQKMLSTYSNFSIDFKNNDCISITELTESGRVKSIKIGNQTLSGTETRKIFNLKSTMFTVKISGNNIIFCVKGYGHGVGLSQTGSDALAKQGFSYEEIIKHYFKNVEITSYSEQ